MCLRQRKGRKNRRGGGGGGESRPAHVELKEMEREGGMKSLWTRRDVWGCNLWFCHQITRTELDEGGRKGTRWDENAHRCCTCARGGVMSSSHTDEEI